MRSLILSVLLGCVCTVLGVPVAAQVPLRKVLFEEFTGEWCSICPAGTIDMERALQAYAGQVVPLSYHNDDPLEPVGFDAMLDSIPFDPLYPGAALDRVPYGLSNPKHRMMVDRPDFLSTLSLAVARPAHVIIRSDVTVEPSARLLTVAAATLFTEADTGDIRIQCIVTENPVRRDNAQRNAFDKDPKSYPQLYGAGDPLRSWDHPHVVRALLGGPTGRAGIVPVQVLPGAEYTTRFTWTVPQQVQLDRIGVVVFAARYARGSLTGNEILNAEGSLASVVTGVAGPPVPHGAEFQLWPNPCSSSAMLRIPEGRDRTRIELFDLLGRQVACAVTPVRDGELRLDLGSAPPGMYLLRIQDETSLVVKPLLKTTAP